MENANATVASISPDTRPLLLRALRGEPAAWPAGKSAGTTLEDEVFRAAQAHGIAGLLHATGAPASWPAALRQRLRLAATQQAMWELRHQQLLAPALARLHEAGIEPVLLKGTPLAYGLYPDPALRRRGDTDLFVPPPQREQAIALLRDLGWSLEMGTRGEFVSYQAALSRTTPEGVHALDLHWRINNAQVLAPLFTHDELHARAVPLPALAPHARGPDDVDALLIACMHRATHRHNPYTVDGEAHHDPDRLIWLADIDLLARRLTGAHWATLVERATRKGLRRVCLDGLSSAEAAFVTPWPQSVREALATPGREGPWDYLQADRMRQLGLDFGALPWSARLRYLAELAFPSPAYMRERFGASRSGLPLLYLRRAALGLRKRLRSHP